MHKGRILRKFDCIDLNRIPGEVKLVEVKMQVDVLGRQLTEFLVWGRRFEYLPVDSDHESSRPNLSIGRESPHVDAI